MTYDFHLKMVLSIFRTFGSVSLSTPWRNLTVVNVYGPTLSLLVSRTKFTWSRFLRNHSLHSWSNFFVHSKLSSEYCSIYTLEKFDSGILYLVFLAISPKMAFFAHFSNHISEFQTFILFQVLLWILCNIIDILLVYT